MFSIKLDLVFILIICRVSDCSRRIQGGTHVTENKTYVAYIVKAPRANRNYDTWLCGGAIITEYFIITSAACVQDVDYLFAVAGYNKYVKDEEILTDTCTKKMKKRIVFTCVPVSYNFDYHKLDRWSYIDIALIRVETPFDFNDENYITLCSYKPSTITINFDAKYQMEGVDAMVMGWGHPEFLRKQSDVGNYNQEYLQYTSTLIMDKRACMDEYAVYPNMTYVIDQFMICTLEPGNLNDKGEPILKTKPVAEGCTRQGLMGQLTPSCEEEEKASPKQGDPFLVPPNGEYVMDGTRRQATKNKTIYNDTMYDIIKKAAQNRFNKTVTRRNGICQNDHGGPLVTWVGSKEVLIGVASVFKVTDYNECIGPFLYTSTQCNGDFIDCVLNRSQFPEKKPGPPGRAGTLCDSAPKVKGYDMVENHISWKDYPDEYENNNIPLQPVRNGPNTQFPHEMNAVPPKPAKNFPIINPVQNAPLVDEEAPINNYAVVNVQSDPYIHTGPKEQIGAIDQPLVHKPPTPNIARIGNGLAMRPQRPLAG